MIQRPLSLLVRTWLVVALIDAIFSSCLVVFAYGSTVSRLWQGVASTVLGPAAFIGGTRTVLIGLLLHLGVALVWSALFLLLVITLPWLRRVIATPTGVVGVAALYGPAIWLAMSLAVIPLLTGRAPTITARWWAQFFGHVPFVALPIVAMIARGVAGLARSPDARAAESVA